MKQILYIGLDPHTLDFSQPGFEPGLTAEKVEQGINTELINLKKLGYAATMHFIDANAPELNSLVERLAATVYDGVLIGAGIRVPPANLLLFEKLLNTVHLQAPAARIIFNTRPLDSAEAIQRWL